jgi:acyl carrier protein
VTVPLESTDSRRLVEQTLLTIAPELAGQPLDGALDLQVDLDLDSMDFLNFVIALHEKTEIEIPERDYPLVSTIDGCVRYLDERR